MKKFERKTDGGLNNWIETYEAMGDSENDAEMLCLLLELRRRRENQAEVDREREELWGEVDKIKVLSRKRLSIACKAFARAEVAEAEIARRDAAAGEPDGYIFCHPSGKNFWSVSHDDTAGHNGVKPFYFAAPPAVLPELEQDVKNIIGLLSENEWAEHCTKSELGRKLEGEITRLHDLRAQQQKVVELPTSFTVIGENIRSQNNRCTADPIFCVFEKVPTPAAEGYNHTRIEWYDSDHDRDATPLQAARLEALFDGGRCDDNDYKCWRRLAMHDVDTFVTACFTFKGCEDYLAQNGHNLRQPFVYVTSAYRNDEYKAVREWLMQLAAAPAPGGDGG